MPVSLFYFFWFYRLLIALWNGFSNRAKMSLLLDAGRRKKLIIFPSGRHCECCIAVAVR